MERKHQESKPQEKKPQDRAGIGVENGEVPYIFCILSRNFISAALPSCPLPETPCTAISSSSTTHSVQTTSKASDLRLALLLTNHEIGSHDPVHPIDTGFRRDRS